MRRAIIDRLLDTEEITAVVGDRVYGREGPYGGVSEQATPEAFTDDGALRPSLVVWLEGRTATTGATRSGRETTTAQQVIAVAVMAERGYGEIRPLVRKVKRALHHPPPRALTPVDEPGVAWTDTAWASDSPDLVDPETGRPYVVTRFAAVINEHLGAA